MCKRKVESIFYEFRSRIPLNRKQCPLGTEKEKQHYVIHFISFITNTVQKKSKCFTNVQSCIKNWLKRYITNNMFYCSTHNSKQEEHYKKYIYRENKSEMKVWDYNFLLKFTIVVEI